MVDVSKANDMIGGISGGLSFVTKGIGGFINKFVTISNVFFLVIVVIIIVVCYKLWEQDVLRRRYYRQRRKEI